MKTVIRNSIFETNSSSVHTIGIAKNQSFTLPSEITFRVGRFGWEKDLAEPKDYLYTAILYMYKYEIEYGNESEKYIKITKDRLGKLKSTLTKHSVKPIFIEPEPDEDYYIDHVDELDFFIDMILDNEDRLLRFLFGHDSFVETGNDNDWYQDIRCCHNDDNYEYFCKGN